MHPRFALAALLLPLAGCVVPPPGPYYPPPVAAAPAEFGYPGYAYNEGSPTYIVGGVTYPLIYYGGYWGYWDRGHRWHRAPDTVWRHLQQRHPGGVGYRPWGGGAMYARPYAGAHPGGYRGGHWSREEGRERRHHRER